MLLVLVAGVVSGQELYWGLKGGLMGNQFTGTQNVQEPEGCCSGYRVDISKLKPGFGVALGAFFEYQLGPKGALRPELNLQFVQQHADFEYGEGPLANGELNDTIQSNNSLTYNRALLEIPLLLKAKLGKKESSYLVFGVFASQLVGESIRGQQVNTTIFPSNNNATTVEVLEDDAIPSEMIRGDGGLVLGYGLHFPVGVNAFETELRIRQGFWNTFAGSDLKVRVINSAVMLNVAYVFDLNQGTQ